MADCGERRAAGCRPACPGCQATYGQTLVDMQQFSLAMTFLQGHVEVARVVKHQRRDLIR